MKKTTTANISGTTFTFEEDAYSELNAYIEQIAERLSGQEDGADIVDDIESRIRELLSEWGAGGMRVVTASMIDRIKATIGDPRIFGAPDFGKTYQKHRTMGRRLMRDTRHRVLGGVCSGLGLYFGIDAAIIRAFALILIFCFGTSCIVYLLLWAIIPKPRTIADFQALEQMEAKRGI